MKKEIDYELEIVNAIKKLLQNKILSGEITVKEIAHGIGVSPMNIYKKLEDYDKFRLKDLDYVLKKWGGEINYYLENILILTPPFVIREDMKEKLMKIMKNNQ